MTDNITVRLAPNIATKQGYFNIPVFSYDFSQTGVHMGSTDHTVDESDITMDITGVVSNPYSWAGASIIRVQFNFNFSNNFVLTELPETPDDVNYCACIRYRIGNEVFRYKLWQGVGEVLNVPLYNGEIIKKNFVIEVWTTRDTNTVECEEAVRLLTSILNKTDEYDDTLFEVATGATHDDLLNITGGEPSPDYTDLIFWYSTETRRISVNVVGVVTGVDVYQGTSFPLTVNGSPVISQDSSLIDFYFPLLGGTKSFTAGPTAECVKFVAMVKVPSTVTPGRILDYNNVIIDFDGSNLVMFANGSYYVSVANTADWLIFTVTLTVSGAYVTQILFTVQDITGLAIANQVYSINTLRLNPGTALALKAGFIGEVMAFTTDVDMTEFLKLLRRNYGFFDIPLEFNPAGYFDDNV